MGCDVGGITPGLGNAATAAASTWFAVITAPDDGEELLGVAFERGNANLLFTAAEGAEVAAATTAAAAVLYPLAAPLA